MSLSAEETQVQVSYDGKVIIPTSRFSISRQYERSGDGTKRRKGWTFNLSGILLAFKGSPDEFGDFHDGPGYPDDPDPSDITGEKLFSNLTVKIQALSELFSTDGLLLEVTPPFGSPLKIRPRWNQLQYPEGPWFNNIKWDITGDCDYIDGIDDYQGELPEESWSLEHTDEVGRVYKLTHTVQAQAKARYALDGTVTPGWQVAKGLVLGNGYGGFRCTSDNDLVTASGHPFSDGQPVRIRENDTIYYVKNADATTFQLSTTVGGAAIVIGTSDELYISPVKLGVFDADLPNRQAPNVLDLTNQLYNYFRSESINEASGVYGVTETWVSFDNSENISGLTGGAAIEDFNVETNASADSGLTTVKLTGNISGLEIRDNVSRALISGRWACAQARATGVTDTWASALANSISGVTINPTPLTKTISRNTITGMYGYSFNFDTRPATSSPSTILSEIITVEFDNAAKIIAQIPVPNRAAGPILQDPNTVTQQSVTVNYDITVKVNYGVTPSVPSTNPYAEAISAIGHTPTTIYMVKDTPRWTKTNGKYSRTTTYIYQD